MTTRICILIRFKNYHLLLGVTTSTVVEYRIYWWQPLLSFLWGINGIPATSYHCLIMICFWIYAFLPSNYCHFALQPILLRSSAVPSFLATMGVEAPWEEEPWFTRMLMHNPNQKEDFHKIDLFHTISLGVGKSFAASAVTILQEILEGTSIEQRVKEISSMYIEYCKEFWQQWFLDNAVVPLFPSKFVSFQVSFYIPMHVFGDVALTASQGKPKNTLHPEDWQGPAWMGWLSRAHGGLVKGCLHHHFVPIFGILLPGLPIRDGWWRRIQVGSISDWELVLCFDSMKLWFPSFLCFLTIPFHSW